MNVPNRVRMNVLWGSLSHPTVLLKLSVDMSHSVHSGDRETVVLEQSQIGFINFIVLPTYTQLACLLPQVIFFLQQRELHATSLLVKCQTKSNSCVCEQFFPV